MSTEAQESQKKTSARHHTEAAKKVRGLVKEMYLRAFQAIMEGKPVAWSMFNPPANEILQAMDVVSVYPENWAGLCAAKRAGEPFILRAEADGFSNVTCSYARIGLGYAAMMQELGMPPPDAPDGGMAKPIMLIGSSLACDTRYKWFQSFARYLDVPYWSFDIPWPPSDNLPRPEVRNQYVKYSLAQLRALVGFMEQRLGRKMDWDKLDEIVRRSEETYRWWWKAYQYRKAVPAPMPSEDGFNCFVPAFFRMGEPEALTFYQELHDELKYRAENGVGIIPNEKYRLLWGGGLPPWHTMQIFNYVHNHGAVFVYETSYRPFEPVDIPDRMGDPLERMAWRSYEGMLVRQRQMKEKGVPGSYNFISTPSPLEFADYHVDGVVFHWLRSCRGTTIGQMYTKNVTQEYSDIPTLFLESDMCDVRDYFEADWKMKIDAFVETVDAYKQKKQSAGA